MKGLTIEPTIATNAIADLVTIENVFHVREQNEIRFTPKTARIAIQQAVISQIQVRAPETVSSNRYMAIAPKMVKDGGSSSRITRCCPSHMAAPKSIFINLFQRNYDKIAIQVDNSEWGLIMSIVKLR
jgi:hypothetical protein